MLLARQTVYVACVIHKRKLCVMFQISQCNFNVAYNLKKKETHTTNTNKLIFTCFWNVIFVIYEGVRTSVFDVIDCNFTSFQLTTSLHLRWSSACPWIYLLKHIKRTVCVCVCVSKPMFSWGKHWFIHVFKLPLLMQDYHWVLLSWKGTAS